MSTLDDKIKIINNIKTSVDDCTLFQLLWYIDQLGEQLIVNKEKLRGCKSIQTTLESKITIGINEDNGIKSINKKSAIELALNDHAEYSKISTEINEIKYIIELIENLIKIVTLKYRLNEQLLHSHVVLTYNQITAEYNSKVRV